MKLVTFLLATIFTPVASFCTNGVGVASRLSDISLSSHDQSRAEFCRNVALVAGAACFAPVEPAVARGRATLEYSYERYVPRIIAGAEFYKKDFQGLVARNDWKGIKNALQEPPKKTKEDRAKDDGGVADRAAQAGKFSDARVLVACDLFAGAFSDSSISPKTKKMQTEVVKLREVVAEMTKIASEALGEDSGGGLFGLGGKKSSEEELRKRMRQLYVEGGAAYNRYLFAANEELPVRFQKIAYM